MANRPILVTGLHRSGSTFTGKILGLSPDVAYIHEPFNPLYPYTTFKKWYYYLQGDPEHNRYIKSLLELRLPLTANLKKTKNFWDLKVLIKRELELYGYRKKKNVRVLFKDPIAFFSAPYLNNEFDFQNIILARHPAAFVSSLKRKEWYFNFRNILDQEDLINDLLPGWKEEIEQAVAEPGDIIDQGCLLWNIFHSTIQKYKEQYPDWLFLRHEDLSYEPIKAFQNVFDYLNLELTPEIKEGIFRYTDAGKSSDPKGKRAESLKRDSRSNIEAWKERLNPEEIKRIKDKTAAIYPSFYPGDFMSPL